MMSWVFCSPLALSPAANRLTAAWRCDSVMSLKPTPVSRRPVNVVPSAPLDVVHREGGGFALLGRQGLQERLRGLHYRLGRHAGRPHGKKAGARCSIGGHALERVSSGIRAAELCPCGKRGEEDDNEEGGEQESAMHRERVAQTAPRHRPATGERGLRAFIRRSPVHRFHPLASVPSLVTMISGATRRNPRFTSVSMWLGVEPPPSAALICFRHEFSP